MVMIGFYCKAKDTGEKNPLTVERGAVADRHSRRAREVLMIDNRRSRERW